MTNLISLRKLAACLVLLTFSVQTLWSAVLQVPVPATANAPTSSRVAGQSATVLPDGRWLLLGGLSNRQAQSTGMVVDPSTGSAIRLASLLVFPRAFHTATMMPDGRILILGGTGTDGKVVPTAELLDLRTRASSVVSVSWFPRAHHTATLLTDGRVLIAGGISGSGQVLEQAELWDALARVRTVISVALSSPRRDHAANLLPDGTVLLWGGSDAYGRGVSYGEAYDPQLQQFSQTSYTRQFQANLSVPFLEASLPQDGATDVPVNAAIALRFSKPLRAQTINASTVTLQGASSAVPATIVPAEGGMLAFVTPQIPLSPSTHYSVSISSAKDLGNQEIAFKQISFTTAGQTPRPAATANTSSGFDARWKNLPPLRAARGTTAVSGQTLVLNGAPLAHVTFEIGHKKAQSDATGRFLLSGLQAGHYAMLIDGSSASTPHNAYGVFEVGVDLMAGVTTVLNYTIWMTRLDLGHAVTIPSPTNSEVVVTTPLLPGLELHIPPNTVIRDHDNKVATQISITPIPLRQPPFPLPKGVDVPIYFTIQPGAAYVDVRSTTGPKGARLYYPNLINAPRGTRFNFWNYNADGNGWYVYGQGTVAPDAKEIIPDPGVVVYEFTGAMVSNPGNAAGSGPPPGGRRGGDPVDLATGLFVYENTDMMLPDVLPIEFRRTYRQGDSASRSFGIGMTSNCDMFLVGDTASYSYVELVLPDGGRIHYNRTSPPGNWVATYQHTSTPTKYYGTTISWTTTRASGYDLRLKDGTIIQFPDAYGKTALQAAMIGVVDRHGNAISIARDVNGNITQITSPHGRWLQFTHDTSNRVTQIKDNMGRSVSYVYDASGRLSTYTDANGGVTTYTYDTSNRMLTIKDPRGTVYLQNQYDANNRISVQTIANGSTYQFAYTVDANNAITQTDMTNPSGFVRRVTFNTPASSPNGFVTGGYALTDIYALGKSTQEQYTYTLQSGSNFPLSITDALSRQTSLTYDGMGNVLSVTRLAGTSNAVTTSYTYDPTFNMVTSVTDGLQHATNYQYDSNGNLVLVTDPLQHTITLTYNTAGQPITVTDGVNHTTTLAYDTGDLVQLTDPLGKGWTNFYDVAGRLISATDPLGNRTVNTYDNQNRLLQTNDPLGNSTTLTYDGNGNLLTVKDAKSNTTTYTYNTMDWVSARKDALLHSDSYIYDRLGNLTQITDRRGKVTAYSYDALSRRTFAGFGKTVVSGVTNYESTINYTYDAGNRLTKTVDSGSGTITSTFDGLDRLTGQTTPQGSVTYMYDAANRRTKMTVAGQTAETYSYDNANRLTGITQGTSAVTVAYDAANRRTTLTLPNGISTQYAYDNDSRGTAITYMQGSTMLGGLTYSYDASGRRTSVGGSFARTNLPNAVTSAAYNADNELTAWGGGTLAYDANGNMTTDGTNTYAWDARNHLSSISGPTTASFQYDPYGRRATKTINGTSTAFLYDRANVVQELSGTTPTANLLTGLKVDETLSRTDSAGRYFLSDVLGSTIALTDSSAVVQTQYTYEPYGSSVAAGTATPNSFQFTGRENDGDALDFLRNRYYSPTFGRFVSQDPADIRGGVNFYTYAAGDPIDFVDPFGLKPHPFSGGPRARCDLRLMKCWDPDAVPLPEDCKDIPCFRTPPIVHPPEPPDWPKEREKCWTTGGFNDPGFPPGVGTPQAVNWGPDYVQFGTDSGKYLGSEPIAPGGGSVGNTGTGVLLLLDPIGKCLYDVDAWQRTFGWY